MRIETGLGQCRVSLAEPRGHRLVVTREAVFGDVSRLPQLDAAIDGSLAQ
ncbi:hypothetical protein GCM10027187_29560 [Streptosporangium sandarakinum]